MIILTLGNRHAGLSLLTGLVLRILFISCGRKKGKSCLWTQANGRAPKSRLRTKHRSPGCFNTQSFPQSPSPYRLNHHFPTIKFSVHKRSLLYTHQVERKHTHNAKHPKICSLWSCVCSWKKSIPESLEVTHWAWIKKHSQACVCFSPLPSPFLGHLYRHFKIHSKHFLFSRNRTDTLDLSFPFTSWGFLRRQSRICSEIHSGVPCHVFIHSFLHSANNNQTNNRLGASFSTRGA